MKEGGVEDMKAGGATVVARVRRRHQYQPRMHLEGVSWASTNSWVFAPFDQCLMRLDRTYLQMMHSHSNDDPYGGTRTLRGRVALYRYSIGIKA